MDGGTRMTLESVKADLNTDIAVCPPTDQHAKDEFLCCSSIKMSSGATVPYDNACWMMSP